MSERPGETRLAVAQRLRFYACDGEPTTPWEDVSVDRAHYLKRADELLALALSREPRPPSEAAHQWSEEACKAAEAVYDAALKLLAACDLADEMEDLSEHIDGTLLQAMTNAIIGYEKATVPPDDPS